MSNAICISPGSWDLTANKGKVFFIIVNILWPFLWYKFYMHIICKEHIFSIANTLCTKHTNCYRSSIRAIYLLSLLSHVWKKSFDELINLRRFWPSEGFCRFSFGSKTFCWVAGVTKRRWCPSNLHKRRT